MAKTIYSVDGRRGYFKINITTAINTALGLAIATPPEEVDLSKVVESVEQNQTADREIAEDYVIGDPDPIVTPAEAHSAESYTVTLFYTQGKETVSSVNVDPYTDILRPLHQLTTALPLQCFWSVGGDVGDEEEATDADETFITSLSKPVVGQSGKVRVSFTIRTPKTQVSVIA